MTPLGSAFASTHYMNIKAIHDLINKLIDMLQSHRDNASMEFAVILEKAQKICEELDGELKRLRVMPLQSYRSNQPSENVEEFFRISLFIRICHFFSEKSTFFNTKKIFAYRFSTQFYCRDTFLIK